MTSVRVHRDGEAPPRAQSSKRTSTDTPAFNNLPEHLHGAEQVRDSRGRVFFLKKMKPSARLNLMIALGELTSNGEVFGRASVVASIAAIFNPQEQGDEAWDYAIGHFRHAQELGIALDRIGDDGWEAVFAGWRKMYGGDAETAEADQRSAAKN